MSNVTTITQEIAVQTAYLTLGAVAFLNLAGISAYEKATASNGHLGLVHDLAHAGRYTAEFIEEVFEEHRETFPGVFEYELTEGMGIWVAQNVDCNAHTDAFCAAFKAELRLRYDELKKDQ